MGSESKLIISWGVWFRAHNSKPNQALLNSSIGESESDLATQLRSLTIRVEYAKLSFFLNISLKLKKGPTAYHVYPFTQYVKTVWKKKRGRKSCDKVPLSKKLQSSFPSGGVSNKVVWFLVRFFHRESFLFFGKAECSKKRTFFSLWLGQGSFTRG